MSTVVKKDESGHPERSDVHGLSKVVKEDESSHTERLHLKRNIWIKFRGRGFIAPNAANVARYGLQMPLLPSLQHLQLLRFFGKLDWLLDVEQGSGDVWVNERDIEILSRRVNLQRELFLSRYTKSYSRKPGWWLLRNSNGTQVQDLFAVLLELLRLLIPMQCTSIWTADTKAVPGPL
jgi:hypothetical protein